MHRPGDPRQTAASDLSKVILCLVVVPKFEHYLGSSLVDHLISLVIERFQLKTQSGTRISSLSYSLKT
jgi:hypothetical protein